MQLHGRRPESSFVHLLFPTHSVQTQSAPLQVSLDSSRLGRTIRLPREEILSDWRCLNVSSEENQVKSENTQSLDAGGLDSKPRGSHCTSYSNFVC